MAILLINAGPGSGKTYTIVNAHIYCLHQRPQEILASEEQKEIFEWCKYNLPDSKSILYLAFNKAIAQTVSKRIPKHCKSYSFHGFGFSCIKSKFGYQKLDDNRSIRIVSELTGKTLDQMTNAEKFSWLAVVKHVEHLKEEWLSPTSENLDFVNKKYSNLVAWKLPEDAEDRARRLMDRMRFPDGSVEYIDMVWLGCQMVKQPMFDIGFVDEAQDLSRARFELAYRACRNLVFVGDPNQAINAFAGADAHMFHHLEEKATLQLPLKTTFRCPPNIVSLANELSHAGISPLPGKPPGREARISSSDLPGHIISLTRTPDRNQEAEQLSENRDGVFSSPDPLPDSPDLRYTNVHTRNERFPKVLSPDKILVLCRMNAPLIRCCLHLIKNGVPSYILQNDFSSTLTSLIKSLRAKSVPDLQDRLDDYILKYTSEKMPPHVRLLAQDKAESILSVLSDCSSIPEVLGRIEDLFQCKPPAVRLTTIHKAKGLEAPEVFILNPPIEHPLGLRTPDGAEQEKNLHFVAITRTSNNLTWVTE